ncbi:uncharacterized protein LOC124265689 [Haliotis rubra]|uniref:uncharacterized protein LOC124265689 n=1 Tax=Haliotis rubra TaxID=36100 RepID=UPI001EE61319|nr:uncharacterized protein LOC124265689 [Haliotis rubra]
MTLDERLFCDDKNSTTTTDSVSKSIVVALISTAIIGGNVLCLIFYYDNIGINCEPFYQNPSITATVMSLFYFIPAAIMLVCYLRILTVATQQKPGGATQAGKQCRPALEMRKHYGRCSQESLKANINTQSMGSRRSLNLKAAKTLGLITIGFFVAVTPWTVTQLVMALGDVKVNPLLDFSVTWLALSNSFWNVIIYCVTSTSFRLAAGRLFSRKQSEVRRCVVHPPRVELLTTRSTVVDSFEHIACNGNTPEEWKGKNGVHVNGHGRYNPESCNNGSDSWRRTQRPCSSGAHQCKRLYSDVPHSVTHSCHGYDREVIFQYEEDIVSQDSFHLSRTHRRKSTRLQDCLCNRTESAPNIPEIEEFPLDSIIKTGHSGINLGSSDSSGSDTILQSD